MSPMILHGLLLGFTFLLITPGVAQIAVGSFVLLPQNYNLYCQGHISYSNGVPDEGAIVELYTQELGEQRNASSSGKPFLHVRTHSSLVRYDSFSRTGQFQLLQYTTCRWYLFLWAVDSVFPINLQLANN